MSLSDLQTRLQDGIGEDGVLPLTRAAFPEFGEALSRLGVTKLLLRQPAVAAPDGRVTVDARTDVLGTQDAGVALAVQGDDAGQVSVDVTLPEHWTFDEGFAGLPGSLRGDPRHPAVATLQPSLLYALSFTAPRVRVQTGTGAPAGLTFTATTSLPREYARLQTLLAVPAAVELHGTVTPAGSGGTPGVDMELRSTRKPVKVGGLEIKDVGLRLRTRPADDDSPALTVLEAEGTLEIGTTAPVEVTISCDYHVDNGVLALEAASPPGSVTVSRGVNALVELMGGTAGEFSLPSPLNVLDAFYLARTWTEVDTRRGMVRYLGMEVDSDQRWEIVEGFHVSGLRFTWLVLFPFLSSRRLNAGIHGTLEFGTARPIRFDVSADKGADFSMEGQLRAGDSINLTELVETALGFKAGLPTIAVDSLDIMATSTGDFRLDGSLSSDWTLDVGGKPFTLERVNFALHREGASKLGLLYGQANVAGTRLYVQATVTSETGSGTGVEFEGGTVALGDPISLTGVAAWALEQFGASMPSAVPEVTLKNLKLRFNTASKEFHVEGETDVPIEVPFLSGDDNRIHAAANLTSKVDSATGKRSLEGWMEGDLTIGSSIFTLRYAMGQATHVFQASWELKPGGQPLGINTLLERIGADGVTIPAGVDLNLTRVYFEYQAELGAFTLVADSATYGEAFLVASRPPDTQSGGSGGGWTFVFGLQYRASKLSEVPVLGSAMGAADVFHFEELGILVSSASARTFTLPQLPPLQSVGGDAGGGNGSSTAVARKPVAAGKTVPLKEGISFLGIIDLESSQGGGGMETLRAVVPAPRLTITAGYDAGAENFMLTGVLDGAVSIPTGGGSDLRIGNAKLELGFPNPIEFRVSGTLDFTVDHQPIHVEPALLLTETEAEFTAELSFGDEGWKSPMGIEGLTLDAVGLAMGVNFVPPGVNIGLQGSAHVGDEAPRADQFAFVLEIVEEIPHPLLLSFQLAELSVEEALRVMVPSVPASDLPEFIRQIRFTDLAFYWAETVVALPDGTVANPGLRFRGNVQILGFAAHAAVSIDTSGLMGEVMLAPVHLGSIVSITGGGEGVYRYERDGRPVMPEVRPDPKAPAPTRVAVVAPGGAVAQFRTKQSPWLYASIDVSLFGIASEKIEALVSAQGVHFKLVYAITDAVSAELECNLDKSGFRAHAKFGLHLKADLGPIRILGVDLGTIHLDAGFDLEMTVEVSAQRFLLRVAGDFEFEGARLTFPTLSIDVAPSSLAELPEQLIRHLGENLEEIFADLFDEAKRALEAAAREVAEAAEAVAKEVEQIGKAAVEEAERLAKEAEAAVEHAAEAVAQEALRVEQEAEKIAKEAVAEVEKIGEAAVQEVERIGGEIVQVAQAAEHEIEAIAGEIAHEAQVVEQAVEQLATEAVHQVEAIAHAVEAEVQQLIADAQRVAQDIYNAARAVVNELERQAEALWNEARHLAEEFADAMRRAAEAVEHAAESAWNTIKKY
jgi:hypothetical protein